MEISDILGFFCCSGKGEAPGRGVGRFLLQIPGGESPRGGEGARDREGVCGEFFGRGGGVNIVFGAAIPTKLMFRLTTVCYISFIAKTFSLN